MSAPPIVATVSSVRSPRRRRLVRGGLLAVSITYVSVLLLLPLVGIIFVALEPGLPIIRETFSQSDVQYAFYL
ncbi:MAG: hypothetical protein ACXWW5_02140, partial [Actinomycetota bacterium]